MPAKQYKIDMYQFTVSNRNGLPILTSRNYRKYERAMAEANEIITHPHYPDACRVSVLNLRTRREEGSIEVTCHDNDQSA